MTLAEALALLEEKQATCLVLQDDKIIYESHAARLEPLFALYHDPDLQARVRGAILIDRVIGKAAYALAADLGVAEIFTPLSSELAFALAKPETGQDSMKQPEQASAKDLPRLHAQTIVPYIMNVRQDGWCPMEAKVRDTQTVADTVERLFL